MGGREGGREGGILGFVERKAQSNKGKNSQGELREGEGGKVREGRV